jgi:hypothetical protein
MNKEDLLWIVGFYEGEGSCGFYPTGRGYYKLLVRITQLEPDVLVYIQKTLGYGRVREHPNGVTKAGEAKRVSIWICESKVARTFLTQILPFVKSPYKRRQIEKALASDRTGTPNARGSVYVTTPNI